MYLYLTASLDATIYEGHPSSNFGQSSFLKVGRVREDDGLKRYRSLIKFDLDYAYSLWNGGIGSNFINTHSSNPTFSLHLFDVYSPQGNQPYGFEICADNLSINKFSNEGRGIEEDGYHTGAPSWIEPMGGVSWTTTGSDHYINAPAGSASMRFESGDEDLQIDIWNYVDLYGSSNKGRYGLVLRLSDDETSDGGFDSENIEEVNTKMFYSRQTSTIFQPRLEIWWDNSIQDDKGRFKYGASKNNSLAYYNYSKSRLQDVTDNDMYLEIFPSGVSHLIGSYTAAHVTTGIYLVENVNITGSYGTSNIDYWELQWKSASTLHNTEYITGSSEVNYSEINSDDEMVINIKNLRSIYSVDEFVRFDLFIRPRYPVYGFTSGNEHLGNMIIPDMWYEIVDADDFSTKYKFMPFNNVATRLSYDNGGNYFNLMMSSFNRHRTYNIKLKYMLNNQTIIHSKRFLFKVV